MELVDKMSLGRIENPVIGVCIRDRRTKRVTSGFDGLSIEFRSKLPLLVGDYVSALFVNKEGEKKGQSFEIQQQWVDGDEIVNIAVEKGFYARNISKKKNFTLLDIINTEIFLIKDEKSIRNIREQSCWC